MRDRESVAVFIDVENIHYSTLNAYSETPDWSWIVNVCRERGRIASIQAFGDWVEFSREIPQIQKNGIQPIFVPLSQNGKSSLDCYLTVSAMKLFFQNETIDTMILASGDRDYIPLIAELKAIGKNVVILAVPDTLSSDLIGIVDDVIAYDAPMGERDREEEREQIDPEEVHDFVSETIKELEESSANDRWVNLSAVGLALKRKDPDFSHKDFGYSKLVGLLDDIPDIEIKYDNYEKTVALARTTKDKPRKERASGKVVMINHNKGYGFIHPESGGENIFFHSSNMESGSFDYLEIGDTLSFYTINTERGESAENIRVER